MYEHLILTSGGEVNPAIKLTGNNLVVTNHENFLKSTTLYTASVQSFRASTKVDPSVVEVCREDGQRAHASARTRLQERKVRLCKRTVKDVPLPHYEP